VTERVQAVVVGGGVMGLATAWALARAGHEPLVLEQFRVGHAHGSSHGATRIFRLAYEEPEWVRLAQEALGLWRELERESGETLLELTGLVDISLDPAALASTLDACGAAHELLDTAELERRFGLATKCCKAVFQAEAGIVRSDRALRAFGAGAQVREETAVRALVPSENSVRIETDGGTIEAEVAVVAAGAWAKPLLAAAGIDLLVVPTRETVAYFELAGERELPSVIDWTNREAYALTAAPGLVKAGVHRSGPPTDPDEPGVPDEAIVRYTAAWAADILPLARPEPVSVETCLYTNTTDHRFVLERHGPIVVCSACSGHGFKFAPAIGVRVAELAGRAQ
jgi:monomeric sarcosine oxidase